MKRTVILTIVLALLLTGVGLAAGSPAIDRYVMGAGGGHAAGGYYSLNSTIGQAVAGMDIQNTFELCSGFQCNSMYKTYLPILLQE